MLLQFHPERKYEIKDNRRSEGHESGIDKIQPDAASREIKLFAQLCAYTKYLIFNVIPKLAHTFFPIITS